MLFKSLCFFGLVIHICYCQSFHILLQKRKLKGICFWSLIKNKKYNKNMRDEDEEIDEGGFKMDLDDDLDLPPEDMTDFGLDEEDPDRDS